MAYSDRISEAHEGETWTTSAQRVARDRIDWLVGQATGEALDIGCSRGIAALRCARCGLSVLGIDVDGDVMAYARADREAEPEQVRERLGSRSPARPHSLFRSTPTASSRYRKSGCSPRTGRTRNVNSVTGPPAMCARRVPEPSCVRCPVRAR